MKTTTIALHNATAIPIRVLGALAVGPLLADRENPCATRDSQRDAEVGMTSMAGTTLHEVIVQAFLSAAQ